MKAGVISVFWESTTNLFQQAHIGLVTGQPAKGRIATIEANTGPAGERDGDGCWEKNRPQEVARCFLRFNFA